MYPREKGISKRCWILVFLLILVLESVGLYYLIESYRDPQSIEISQFSSDLNAWNSALTDFKNINASIPPFIKLTQNTSEY